MMSINAIEMINILVVICLLIVISSHRDTRILLLGLFLYGTFHFSYSTIALTSQDYTNQWTVLHSNGSGILAESSALVLLICVFLLLSKHAYQQFIVSDKSDKKATYLIFLVLIVTLFGYFFNVRIDDWAQLKNVLSMMALFVLLIIGSLGLMGKEVKPLNINKIYFVCVGGLLFLLIDSLAIYEVFTHRSWAGTLQSSGDMVYRASSTLFNPNLFGLWASLVYLGCTYGFYEYTHNRKIMICGMILASIAIYFSGSRSAGFILLATLCLSTLLLKERLRWAQLVVFILPMLSLYIMTLLFIIPNVTSEDGWYEIVLLGERFANTPFQVMNYISTYLGSAPPFQIPIEIQQSIEGRFLGEERDGGWIAFYFDVGWLGVAAVILMSFVALVQAVKSYYRLHNIKSVFALTILCYCLLIGVTMRYQVFPIWLFIGVALTPCVAFWSRSDSV